jgi:hypothetical protein
MDLRSLTRMLRHRAKLREGCANRGDGPGIVTSGANICYIRVERNETAFRLGHEGANCFFRAFRNWEGTLPGNGGQFTREPERRRKLGKKAGVDFQT